METVVVVVVMIVAVAAVVVHFVLNIFQLEHLPLEMWANAQRDGRPAEYRWRPLFNAATKACINNRKKTC